MQQPVYRRGETVEVFYRMGVDEGMYFPVLVPSAGQLRPRYGRSDGWITARVEEDWPLPTPSPPQPHFDAAGNQMPPLPPNPPPNHPHAFHNGRVCVRHVHPYWSNKRGERLDPFDDRDMVVFMQPCDVRRPMPMYAPAVSLLVVRWGAEQTQFNNEQWGQASSSVSDSYVDHVLDKTLYSRLGPDYEVVTAFVESGHDLKALQPGAIAPMLRGRHVGALYFLWPVMAQDGDVEQSGMVNEALYFDCVRQFEAAGLPTRFPHSSQLYETILSKDWQPALCLHARLRIPPATVINRAAIVRCPRRAAATVMDALEAIREMRYGEAGGEPECIRPMENEVRRGVVKLGFAWEAAHVRVFRGESQLAEAMRGLVATPGVLSSAVIVQDFVRNHMEIRCFVVDGQVAHIIYSSFERVDVDGYPRDFVKKVIREHIRTRTQARTQPHLSITTALSHFSILSSHSQERADAVNDWLNGDHAAMEDAEKKAGRLVRHWLTWLRCRSAEPTPCIRMDILVSRIGPGKSEVHTLELTEMGFSMLAWPEGPQVVFNALIESFFTDVEHTAQDAEKLASTRPVGGKADLLALGEKGANKGNGSSKAKKKQKGEHPKGSPDRMSMSRDGAGSESGASTSTNGASKREIERSSEVSTA